MSDPTRFWRRRSGGLLLTALAMVVAVAGCAGGEGAGGDGGDGDHAVEVKNIAFTPAEIRVPAGATVTWTSADAGVAHTVTSGTPGDVGVPGVSEPAPHRPDGTFDGALADAGATFEFTFDQSGNFDYYCAVHPSMTGQVVVD